MPLYAAARVWDPKFDPLKPGRIEVWPDLAGLKSVRWRVVGTDPWWYVETDKPLVGETEAPKNYPNGVLVYSPDCPTEWHEAGEEPPPREALPRPVDRRNTAFWNPRSHTVKALEFWTDKGVRLSRLAQDRLGYTAKETVLVSLDKLPAEKWKYAVAECEDGSRQQAVLTKPFAELRELDAALHAQNTYVAPNFNIDSSTNVAGLTALKGSAPALTDNIYVYGVGGVGATLTVESALSILKIYLGQMSSGAASATNRYGLLVVDAGVTVTFAGAAAASSSGQQAVPASADASSLGCRANLNGTSAANVILTNSGDAANVTQRWSFQMSYGTLVGTFTQYKWMGTGAVYAMPSTVRTSSAIGLSISDSAVFGIENTGVFVYFPGAVAWDLPVTIDGVDLTLLNVANTYLLSLVAATGLDAGGSLAVSRLKVTPVAATNAFFPFSGIESTAACYSLGFRFELSDIRQTKVVPTGLAFTDPATSGELRFTITNAASYVDADTIVVYNNAGGAELGRVTKAKYALDGYGQLTGLSDNTLYTMYAKATSDNQIFSAATATATGTPTAGTSPVFSGITGLVDNGDGTLTASWGAATGEDHFEVHLHTASMSAANLNSRDYLVAAVDADATSCKLKFTAAMAALVAGTTYYVAVRAVNSAGTDGNTANLNVVASATTGNGVAYALVDQTPVQLGAGATTIYTVPAGKRATARILLTNTDVAARTVTIYKVKAGDAAADDVAQVKTYSLAAAGAADSILPLGPWTLDAGTVLSGLASVGAVVTATVTTCMEQTL